MVCVLSLASCILVLFASLWSANAAGILNGTRFGSQVPAIGVTSEFERRVRPSGLSTAEIAFLVRKTPVRKSDGVGRSEAAAREEDGYIEQVHVGLHGPATALVTYATWKRGLPSAVYFGQEADQMRDVAYGEVSSYTALLCPTNELIAREPIMGEPTLENRTLRKLLDTSDVFPEGTEAYSHVPFDADPWSRLVGGCVDDRNPNAFYQAPYIHSVVLANLTPGKRYYYKPAGASRSFSFASPVAPGQWNSSQPLRIGLWADVGITNVSHATMRDLAKRRPDVAMLVGDFSYADGYHPKWDTFGLLMEELMAAVPHLTVPGNHEIAEGLENGIHWTQRYPVPFRASGSPSPLFYSYEMGLVHFLCLAGSYVPSGPSSAQYKFIHKDFRRVNRIRTPWLIVLFHAPMYNSNQVHFQESFKLQEDLEDLFYKFGVDIVFNGHVHSYERTRPVYRNNPDHCGTTHIVIGDAGSYEGPTVNWKNPQPEWSAFREASFGNGMLTIFNDTFARFEWHRTACASEVGLTSYGEPRYEWKPGTNTETCYTDGDTSQQRYERKDAANIIRDVASCPGKAAGGGHGIQPEIRTLPAAKKTQQKAFHSTLSRRILPPVVVSNVSEKRILSGATSMVHRPKPAPIWFPSELRRALVPWSRQGAERVRSRSHSPSAVLTDFPSRSRVSNSAHRSAGVSSLPHEQTASVEGQDGSVETDQVQQVHVGFLAQREAVITFASNEDGLSSDVMFGVEGEGLTERATGDVTTYFTMVCPYHLPQKYADDLAELANTSAFLPRNSTAYVKVKKGEDTHRFLSNGCLPYFNPSANYQSPYIHTAVLKDLRPRTRYVYRPAASSREFVLTTPPDSGQFDPLKPLKLAVWADVGVTATSFATMEGIKAMEPDAVLLGGDISYADGWNARWDDFSAMAEPLMSSVATLSVPGNHELVTGRTAGLDWIHRFPVPYRASGSETPLYYSYDIGLVHVLCLAGTYAPSHAGSPQYEFVMDDLRSVDRQKTPWVVVLFHVPWYSSIIAPPRSEARVIRQSLEHVFYRYGVDLVLSGHVHKYERTYPVFDGVPNDCGTTHIAVADAGNIDGPEFPWPPQPEWSAFRECAPGAGMLVVHNSTHAEWDWYHFACAEDSPATTTIASTVFCEVPGERSLGGGRAADSIVLHRDVTRCPNRAVGSGDILRSRGSAAVYFPMFYARLFLQATVFLVIFIVFEG